MTFTKSMTHRKTVLFIATLALAVVACLGVAYANSCEYYDHSRVTYWQGTPYCMGNGSGCRECTNDGGGSCVTNGLSCEPLVDN